MAERAVLHVLPHPGGGGETYVDSLARMEGFRQERVFLAPSRELLRAAPSLATSVPRVNIQARRFDIVQVHGEVAGFLCLAALARRPSVVTLHGLNLVRRSARLIEPAAVLNLRLIVRTAARTICVSEEERREVAALVGKGLAGRLEVVPNGVEPPGPPSSEERKAARTEFGLEGRTVVVSVGGLDPPKDPLTIANAAISAARGGFPIVLVIAGDGSLRSRLEDIARESEGVVRVLGHRLDVARLLAAADVFALSSRHEGHPYALLEAMAAGLPCVVSDYPGAADVVGEGGVVVSQGDIDALAQALGRLTDDASLRAAIGEKARRRVETRFPLKQMVDSTKRVYETAMTARPARATPGK